MLAAELTIFGLLSFLFLCIGGVIGWLAKMHSYETQPQRILMHPEMFDNQGNLVPDEILAVRFENGYFDAETDEDDED
jgi:hypothetical protein